MKYSLNTRSLNACRFCLLIAVCLCSSFLACEQQGLQPGIIELELEILLPFGEEQQEPGISLKLKNNGDKTVHIRTIEVLMLNDRGEPWPSLERAIRILNLNQDIAAGEERKMLFKLDDTPQGTLMARIIRVNGLPYNS